MTDPIFNRDIGFFLFELPFLRLVQGLFNGLVVGALLVTLARYLVSATHGGLVFSTPVRVHLAVLGGLFLLSVAFGYQLDKLELVVQHPGRRDGRQLHRPERAVLRLRHPDRSCPGSRPRSSSAARSPGCSGRWG